MEAKTGNFYQVGVRQIKTLEDGRDAKVTENLVVEAQSWSECETNTIGNYNPISEDFSIPTMKKADFNEIFVSENDGDDKYYECSLTFITIDETSAKEKRSKNKYLVQASSIEKARKNIDEAMKDSMVDYTINCIKETAITEIVFSER